jgi:hypothetical protein
LTEGKDCVERGYLVAGDLSAAEAAELPIFGAAGEPRYARSDSNRCRYDETHAPSSV